jgi:hypothetical protein
MWALPLSVWTTPGSRLGTRVAAAHQNQDRDGK